jgi:hypothetical protein
MKRLLAAAAMIAATCSPAPAQTTAEDAQSVIARMAEQNPSLESYRARVHVALHMTSFPFLAPKLDGTSYFKRPDNYEVVFDRVPHYMKGFERLFDDVGDPLSWEREQNISFEGTTMLYGRPVLVLNMTKKIHSTILDHTTAYVDPDSYRLVQMEWHYTSGGTIVMRQWYREVGSFAVISQQHVEINLPHVHAVGDSVYDAYQTNVAVDDAVFTQKP